MNSSTNPDLSPLLDWLKFPSISGDINHQQDLENCAGFIAEYLQKIGLETVQVHKTPQHPIVYAEHCKASGKPTILIYGHYDVQPVDPLELWDSDPFDPQFRGEYLYARGVADNKGQIFCHLKALELLLKETGTLPVNVKILIEGEEEIGSPNLMPFVEQHKELLSADIMLISDNPMFAKDQPSLCVALRGLTYLEFTLSCLSGDLHSGQHGGAAPNAIHELMALLSQLKDADSGKILIPGFYEPIKSLPDSLKSSLEQTPFNEDEYMASIGAKTVIGEPGKSIPEKLWYRPSLDINGIWGGFTEAGAKTVIPAQASAKLSMRLVLGQEPGDIQDKAIAYLQSIAPEHVSLDFTRHHGCSPAQMATEGPFLEAAKQALEQAFGVSPILQGEGGSIPIVADFQKALGLDTVMMGFNNTDDNIHAPNERMRVANIEKGIVASKVFLSFERSES